MSNASNVVLSGTTGNVVATASADWNRSIPAGGSQSFGFQANGTVRPELTSLSISSGGGTGGDSGSGSAGAGGTSGSGGPGSGMSG